jgi:sporulation protein YabP
METQEKNQELIIKNRSTLILDAVHDVIAFTPEELEISTYLGDVIVEGDGLRIIELYSASEKIIITGKINGFYYKNDEPKNRNIKRKK